MNEALKPIDVEQERKKRESRKQKDGEFREREIEKNLER